MEAVMIIFMMNDEDVERILKDPGTMIGSDGIPSMGSAKPHPRMTGTFPRILGHYVREKGVISLEEAVRKMTSLPAQTFGLYKKGILRPGMDADLVISITSYNVCYTKLLRLINAVVYAPIPKKATWPKLYSPANPSSRFKDMAKTA